MNVYIEREFEAYRKDDAEARSILDTAAEETRSTTPEEDERFEKLIESARAHKQRADKLVQAEQDAASLSESVRSFIDTTGGSGAPGGVRSGEALMESVRSTLAGLKAGGEKPRPVSFDLDLDAEDVVRAITDFGNGTSLYASDFQTRVQVYERTMSPWIAQATIINANNGRPLIIPTSSADPTSYTPGEGTAITASDPTLGTATATPTSYKALGYISQEAEEDEVVGLMSVIAMQQGRSLGLALGAGITTVVLAGAANGGTATGVGGDGTATVAFFGYEDLLDLKYGRAAPYRMVGTWAMSNGAIKKVRKFKDSNRQYYWQPAIAAGQPDTFDGDAVFEDPSLAAPASATKSVVYGDASLVIVKQMPLRVAVSTEYAFNLDNVAIKSVLRAGAAVADGAALAYLVSATT